MSDPLKKYIQQWINKAEEDLLVINQLLTMDILPKTAIGFHCQQSAEKFLKAFLVFHYVDFPKTHNIEFLIEQCVKVDPDFNDIESGNLTDYGVEIRYPGDFLEPTLSEIETLFHLVELIKELVLKKIQL